jgi:hypothetical protein
MMVRIPGTTFSDTPTDHKAINRGRIKKIKDLVSECDSDCCSVNDLMGKLLEIDEICDAVLDSGESDDN